MPLTVGTAGHIDHGKTTLVEALTGTNTDRLAEEQNRGISIELGYAALDLGDGLVLSIVDVPGHERFVRTMVAGATGIDLALVCIACDDGVMPQTREHLAILDLLGVESGVVALTRSDLTDIEGIELARDDALAALAGTRLAGAPIVAVSARTGRGLPELRTALRRSAGAVAARSADGRARLPIDRVFTLHGIGTVVTGTLWSGTLRAGGRVQIAPSTREARIRSLQSHGEDAATATAGRRVAVSLVGVERGELRRGDVLYDGPPLQESYRLDVDLHAVADGPGLRHGAAVEVLHGTASAHARVVLFDGGALAPGADGLAQLRLDQPLAALRGDRVVVRLLAPPTTVAGGPVLDPVPPRDAGSARARLLLATLAGADDAAILLALAGDDAMPGDAAIVRGVLGPERNAAALLALLADGRLLALDGGYVIAAATYERLATDVAARLAAHAAASPLAPSLRVGAVLGSGPARPALTARLERDGVLVRDAGGVRAAASEAASAAAAPAAAALLQALGETPFAPPRLEDAMAGLGLSATEGKALLAVLEREGELVRLPDGLAVLRSAYDEACAIVRAGCAERGSFTLAELRDATGTSRRYAQALLERMDADGVTRRVGDARVLRRGRAGAG